MVSRGHQVRVFEPRDAWSVQHLIAEHGAPPLAEFFAAYPALRSHAYSHDDDLHALLDEIDLAIVHEWNDHELVHRIGRHRAQRRDLALLFHDTHHRAVTDPASMAKYDLKNYDGVLAFGDVLRELYLHKGWTRRAWTWHEAADIRLFRPIHDQPRAGDLIWIGNWGDDERSAELHEFLIDPVRSLKLRATVHGVRYPAPAREALARAGIQYAGWIPNYRVPDVFARFAITIHVPRRPYTRALPGIPTIRVFEALACGIPLVCSPWDDAEHLFSPGDDYLVARDGSEMLRHLRALLDDPHAARAMAMHGHRTILSRHTCAHRVDELETIYHELRDERAANRHRPREIASPAGALL